MSAPCLLAPGARLCIAQLCNHHGVWLHLADYLGMVDWVRFLATVRTIALCRPIPWPLAAPAFLVRRERWPLKEPYRSTVLPFGEPSRRWIQSFCVAAMHGRRIWRYLREQESASIAVSQSSRESMAGQPELSQEFANIAVSQWMDVHKERAFHLNLD